MDIKEEKTVRKILFFAKNLLEKDNTFIGTYLQDRIWEKWIIENNIEL